MNELPDLVILLISRYLSYNDNQSLRLTCKRLKETIDQRTSRSLHLLVEAYPFERNLFYTDELVSYANTLHVSDSDMLKSNKFKRRFSGLLKLTIYKNTYLDRNIPLDSKDLNSYQQLVHLELVGVELKGKALSLKNLKILFLGYHICGFELDCPQLKALGFIYPNRPILTDATSRSIEYLYLKVIVDMEDYVLSLYSKLSNLSGIAFKSSFALDSFVLALIERRVCLPRLKQINLERDIFSNEGSELKNLADLKNRPETRYIEIRINRKAMSRDELIEMRRLLGIPNTSGRLLCGLFRYCAENPVLHCLIPTFDLLELRSDEDVSLSKPLIAKLRNLEDLRLKKGISIETNDFECLLKACRKVWCLLIECDTLNQQQLDLMPSYLWNVKSLKFRDDFWLGDFSLGFVAKFKNLQAVTFNRNIPKESMSFLLKSCKHQLNFHLGLRGAQNIWIFAQRFEIIYGKRTNNNHEIKTNKKIEFDSIEDAIEHYYQNDLFNTAFSRD